MAAPTNAAIAISARGGRRRIAARSSVVDGPGSAGFTGSASVRGAPSASSGGASPSAARPCASALPNGLGAVVATRRGAGAVGPTSSFVRAGASWRTNSPSAVAPLGGDEPPARVLAALAPLGDADVTQHDRLGGLGQEPRARRPLRREAPGRRRAPHAARPELPRALGRAERIFRPALDQPIA